MWSYYYEIVHMNKDVFNLISVMIDKFKWCVFQWLNLDWHYIHRLVDESWFFPVFGSIPRAVEEETASVSFPPAMVSIIEKETRHLKPSHLKYFSLWYLMLTLEMQTGESRKGYKNIWMIPSLER